MALSLCAGCGREITVFIGGPAGLDWAYQPYCEICRESPATGGACSACKTTFQDFLDRGRLGCETCYTAHGARLKTLLADYRTPVRPVANVRTLTIDSLARARSQELRALVLGSEAEFEARLYEDGFLDAQGEAQVPEEDRPDAGAHAGNDPESFRPATGIIRSLRIRLARNLVGLPYHHGLSEDSRHRLREGLVSPGSVLGARRAAQGRRELPRFDCITEDEDHLRIQWLWRAEENGTGPAAWIDRTAEEIARIDRLYLWQHHRDFGWLTACPANAGSGLRFSVEVYVPALFRRGRWSDWRRELENAGLLLRGARGEGSPAGPSLQISNRHWPAGIDLGQEARVLLAIIGRMADQERELS